MKIGIITHHYVKNYGAYLQARALMGVLESLEPEADVSIVNYIEKKHWYKNIIHILHYRIGKDNIKTYIEKIKQLFMFSKYEHSLKHSKRVYKVGQIEQLGNDVIIIGSDEVWNIHSSGFNPLKFGYGFQPGTKLATYAPSAGAVTDETVVPDKVKEGLKNIKYLSARDTESQKFVKRAIGKEALKVLDPTLLYNFDKEIDEQGIKPLPYKYILIYDCKLVASQIEHLKTYAKKNNLKVIGGGDCMEYYDDIKISLTPYEWVSLFRNAEMVLTGTFHGTVFSIKYLKKFVSYPTEKNRINKIKSLLGDMDLLERLLPVGNEDNLIPLLEEYVDYDKAYVQIDKRKKESIEFLRTVITQ